MKVWNIVTAILIAASAYLVIGNAGAAANSVTVGEYEIEILKSDSPGCPVPLDPQSQQIIESLQAFSDVELMAQTMADPMKFFKLVQTVSNPATIQVMVECAMNPDMWKTWVKSLNDPEKMMRASMILMDPAVHMKWMMVPMNPATYSTMTNMMSPDRYMLWMNALMGPSFYKPMMAPMTPGWIDPRMKFFTNPQNFGVATPK